MMKNKKSIIIFVFIFSCNVAVAAHRIDVREHFVTHTDGNGDIAGDDKRKLSWRDTLRGWFFGRENDSKPDQRGGGQSVLKSGSHT